MGLKGSLILTLIVALIAFIGLRAVQGALQVRSDNASYATDSARVTGRIVSHESYTDTSAQRKSWYKPVVTYTVDGRTYQVTAQNGVDLTKAMTEFKEGTPIEVTYLRDRPREARVVGFEFESWVGLAVFGSMMMALPLAATAFGIWRRWLFAGSGRAA